MSLGAARYYLPDVLSYSDYYPFGMQMVGRNGNTEDYRFGFQGEETDDEITGSKSHVAFTYRCHDARLGRFLSLDPLAPKYPHYSPYSFSGNRVIDHIDLEGLENLDVDVAEEAEVGKPGLATATISRTDYVVTGGDNAVDPSNIDEAAYEDEFTKGNRTMYFSSLPSSTTAGVELTSKQHRLRRNGKLNIAYYEVDVLFEIDLVIFDNFTIENYGSLKDGLDWEDRNGIGAVATPKVGGRNPGEKGALKAFNTSAAGDYSPSGTENIIWLPKFAPSWVGLTHTDPKILANYGRYTKYVDHTGTLIHGAGNTMALENNHGVPGYQYGDKGLQSNAAVIMYVTAANTLAILNDIEVRRSLLRDR